MNTLLLILFSQLLGSDSFQVREYSETICPSFVAVQLQKVDDPEIKFRASRVLDRSGIFTSQQRRRTIMLAASGFPRLWIDGLPVTYPGYPSIVNQYRGKFLSLVPNSSPDYVADRCAAMEFFGDCAETMPLVEVLLLLKQTSYRCDNHWDIEKGVWRDMGIPNNLPPGR